MWAMSLRPHVNNKHGREMNTFAINGAGASKGSPFWRTVLKGEMRKTIRMSNMIVILTHCSVRRHEQNDRDSQDIVRQGHSKKGSSVSLVDTRPKMLAIAERRNSSQLPKGERNSGD